MVMVGYDNISITAFRESLNYTLLSVIDTIASCCNRGVLSFCDKRGLFRKIPATSSTTSDQELMIVINREFN